MNWETGIDIYTLLIQCEKQITNKNLLYSTGNSTMLHGDLNGKEIRKRGDMCICSLVDQMVKNLPARQETWVQL